MTYSESAKGQTITRKRALRELADHGLPLDEATLADFYSECGDNETYSAAAVLHFLGY